MSVDSDASLLRSSIGECKTYCCVMLLGSRLMQLPNHEPSPLLSRTLKQTNHSWAEKTREPHSLQEGRSLGHRRTEPAPDGEAAVDALINLSMKYPLGIVIFRAAWKHFSAHAEQNSFAGRKLKEEIRGHQLQDGARFGRLRSLRQPSCLSGNFSVSSGGPKVKVGRSAPPRTSIRRQNSRHRQGQATC